MQNGVSVWLDVPLEALAQRIAAVGTNSRPLLHNDSGNEYTKVASLFTILFFIYAMVSNQARKGIHIVFRHFNFSTGFQAFVYFA